MRECSSTYSGEVVGVLAGIINFSNRVFIFISFFFNFLFRLFLPLGGTEFVHFLAGLVTPGQSSCSLFIIFFISSIIILFCIIFFISSLQYNPWLKL